MPLLPGRVLARIYSEANMFDQAIDMYARVLADREWVLGPEHADTFGVRSQLAGTYLAASQAGSGDRAVPAQLGRLGAGARTRAP